MLILKNNGALIASLKIRLASAKQTNDLEFYASYYDGPSSSYGDSHGNTNGTAQVLMVGPTIGQYRQIKYISVYNGDSQLSTIIFEIVKTNGTTTETIHLHSCVLDQGDTLNYTEDDGFRVLEQSGKLKVTVAAPGGGGGGSGTVTSVSVANAHGFSGTVSNPTSTPAISIIAGNITPTSVAATGTVTGSNLSGTNTGDQDLSNYFDKTADDTDDITEGTINKFSTSGEKTKLGFITITQAVDLDTLESDTAANNAKISNATHSGDAVGSGALTVTGINGTQLASLATGILKNTTVTGVPSIAVAADFPTLNQNTTGSAATLTTPRTINGVAFNGSANITIAADASTLTGTSLAGAVVSSSLTSVGTLTNLTVTNTINGTAKGLNGVQTSTLATGILKNTTTTGVPSIAVAADFPVLNQNTTGSAATLTTPRTINGVAFDGSANITVTANAGTLTGNTLASGVLASSLTSVGTLSGLTVSTPIVGSITGNAATVSTNANLTGPITSLGNATAIANNVVTNAMLASTATGIIKGRNTAGVGNVEDLSPTTVTAMLDVFDSTHKGLVPLSGGGTLNFLRADGTWTTPPVGGSGTVTQVSVVTANGFSGTVATNSTTPAITIVAGAITPTSVAATGTVTGSNLSGTNTGDQTSVTGNAGTATVLQTARTINGVSFNGSANITVPADAGTLTGTTLASTVIGSSLTSVGTITSGGLGTGAVLGGVTITLGADAANDIYYRNSSGVLARIGNGTTGQVLTANTAAPPNWATPSGGGGGVTDGDKGDVLVSGTGSVWTVEGATGSFAFSGVTSPAQFTTDQNDLAIGSNVIIRISSNSDARRISSVAGGTSGRIIVLKNIGNSDIIISQDDGATGTAANRFELNGYDVVIEPKNSVIFEYDATLSRWINMGGVDNDLTEMRRQPIYACDYFATGNPLLPYTATAVSSGTLAHVVNLTDHPGYMTITSSTTANSGGQSFLFGSQAAMLFSGGEAYECIFQPKVASNTATTIRFGFLDTITSADAVDGAYFELPAASFAIVGKTSSNSVRTTSATIATLAVNTWYRAKITVNRAATSIKFEIFDANGVSLGSQSITTNIPVAAGREFGVGFVATNSGTAATLLTWLDYQAVQLGAGRPMVR